MKRRPSVLLADDHKIVAEGLRRILEQEFDLVDAVADGRAMIEAATRLRPDVIVADIAMPELNGLEAARRLKKSKVASKIIFLTMHADTEFALEALEVGATGYVLKHAAAEELTRAIREVLKGGLYLSQPIANEVLQILESQGGKPERQRARLTPREREVLRLVAEGYTMAQIADALNVSTRTVEFHKYNLSDKLGLRTTAELTQYAVRHGIVA